MTAAMPSPKYLPEASTWAITALALHSSPPGRSPNRAAGTATAACRSSAIAAWTFSTMAAGVSFAPWATR